MATSSLTKKGLLAAADKVIIGARPALELVSQFTTDFSAEAVKPGTGVAVDVLKAGTATFVKGTNDYGTGNTGTVKNITVTTDIRKISSFMLDDLDALEDETSHLWDKFGPAAGRAIGADLVKSVTGKLTRTNRADAYTLAGSPALGDFFKIRGYIEGKGIDPSTCVLLLEPTTYSLLCSLLNAGIVGDGSVVRAGIIGQALGFKSVFSGPTISTDGAAASDGKGKGFVVPENALAVVNRVVKPIKGVAGGLLEYGVSTDEVSGVSISQRVVYDAKAGECWWSAEGLFGSKLTLADSNGAPGYYQIVVS